MTAMGKSTKTTYFSFSKSTATKKESKIAANHSTFVKNYLLSTYITRILRKYSSGAEILAFSAVLTKKIKAKKTELNKMPTYGSRRLPILEI